MGAVEEYYNTFAAPIPLKVLSAKYAKALNRVGSFVSTMDELFQDGSVDIVLLRTGGKAVYPGGTLCVVNPAEAALLKRG